MSVRQARRLRQNMTAPEVRLWSALRQLKGVGQHWRRQVQIGPYYADFAWHAGRLVIEVDGDSHYFGDAPTRDALRDRRFAADGYHVLRVTNDDVMHGLDGVIEVVLEAAKPPTLDPSPRGGGRR